MSAYYVRFSDWSSDVCSSDLDRGVVSLDRPGDLFHDRGLARLRRRHDQAALALTDRRDEVDDPRRHVGRVVGPLEGELLVGEERGQVLEAAAVAGLLRVDAVDRVDPQQRGVLLVAQGGTAGADDVVALAEAELPGLLDRSEEHTSELQSLMRISYAV